MRSPDVHKHLKGLAAAALAAAVLSTAGIAVAGEAKYPDRIVLHSGPPISGVKIL